MNGEKYVNQYYILLLFIWRHFSQSDWLTETERRKSALVTVCWSVCTSPFSYNRWIAARHFRKKSRAQLDWLIWDGIMFPKRNGWVPPHDGHFCSGSKESFLVNLVEMSERTEGCYFSLKNTFNLACLYYNAILLLQGTRKHTAVSV